MSVRKTSILNRSDLKYLLIDSLRNYSDNLKFIDGNNPFKFTYNNKVLNVFIRNVHESGNTRTNEDECSMQISSTKSLRKTLHSSDLVIFLGYFPDEKVFSGWNPFILTKRFKSDSVFLKDNSKKNIRVYSRFSIQESAREKKISCYVDNNQQSVISFKPEYLGLYLENINNIHNLSETELVQLVKFSDDVNISDFSGSISLGKEYCFVTHKRFKRDQNFRKKVYEAYNNKCAMCGIQLELIEAAHIVPHSHESGTDDISNGICLCSLHHSAYDSSLIYFECDFSIKFNIEKLNYLKKMGLDGDFIKFKELSFNKIKLPDNHFFIPKPENISLANKVRGIL